MFSCSRVLKSLTHSTHKATLVSARMLTCHKEDDLMLFHCSSKTSKNDFLSLHFNNKKLEKYSEYRFPFKNGGFRIFGACKGVVCISDTKSIHLWNPKNGTQETLPEPRVPFRDHIIGLGYDEKTQDLKVVKFSKSEVDIYKLSTRKWENMSNIEVTKQPGRGQVAVYLNGAVHWLANMNKIVSFHASDDEFQEIYLNNEILYAGFSYESITTRLAVYKGCLAIVVWESNEKGPFSMPRESAEALVKESFESDLKPDIMLWSVWVKKEKGKYDKFTKKCSIWGTIDFGKYFVGFGKEGEVLVTPAAGFAYCAYSDDGSELVVKVVEIDGAASILSPVFASLFGESDVSLGGVENRNEVEETDEAKDEALA